MTSRSWRKTSRSFWGCKQVIKLKNAKDIAGIWRSGQVSGKLHKELRHRLNAGMTTKELDDFAQDFIKKHKGRAAFLGYRGFPGALCVSLNEEIVHGIPNERVIQEGDLVKIDLGVILDNYYSDTAMTWLIAEGNATDDFSSAGKRVEELCIGTRQSLDAGISAVASGKRIRDVSRAVQDTLMDARLGIVRELTGHGVGFALHEEPTVYNYDSGASGPALNDGVVLAIEPMATLGTEEILLAADDWTYLTADGSLSAHYEHTVVKWDGGVFVLTDPEDDDARQAFSRQ